MSIKWYEKHMEEIVRENQTLRFLNKKNADSQVIEKLSELFKELFPELPTLSLANSQSRNVDDVLKYYKTCGQKWIDMVKTKLQIYQQNVLSEEKEEKIDSNVPQSDGKSINLKMIKEKEMCLLCGNPKQRDAYQKLKRKIDKLENAISDLKNSIQKYERKEEQYLKQIFSLRSTTKQYEFQLQSNIYTYQKIQKAYLIKEHELQSQVFNLKKENQMWREEYDRIWHQQMKKMTFNEGNSEFQEQRALLNAFQCQEKEFLEQSNSHSHFWFLKSDSIDHSEAQEKKDDIPSLPSTSRQSTIK